MLAIQKMSKIEARSSKQKNIPKPSIGKNVQHLFLIHDQSCTEIPTGNPYGLIYILTYYVKRFGVTNCVFLNVKVFTHTQRST